MSGHSGPGCGYIEADLRRIIILRALDLSSAFGITIVNQSVSSALSSSASMSAVIQLWPELKRAISAAFGAECNLMASSESQICLD